MFILDALRPYFVGNSLYNSVVTTALALPLALILGAGWVILLRWLVPQRYRWVAALGIALCISTVNLWLLPWIAAQIPLQLSEPMIAMAIGSSPALAWSVAPFVAMVATFNNPHRLSENIGTKAKAWQDFFVAMMTALVLLLCNASSTLLLTGGRPFNATHTLASWIFTQAWTNGDVAHSSIQAALLSVFVTVILFITQWLNGRNIHYTKNWRLLSRQIVPGLSPVFLIAIPFFFRWFGWEDGRVPLFTADMACSLLLVQWAFLQRWGN